MQLNGRSAEITMEMEGKSSELSNKECVTPPLSQLCTEREMERCRKSTTRGEKKESKWSRGSEFYWDIPRRDID